MAVTGRSGWAQDDRAGPGALVALDVDCDDGVFELVLVNLGPLVASEIEVTFSDGLLGMEGRPIAELPVWSRLRTLRPGKEIRVLLDTTQRLRDDRKGTQFSATVAWSSLDLRHEATYEHDLGAYAGLPQRVARPDTRSGHAANDHRWEMRR